MFACSANFATNSMDMMARTGSNKSNRDWACLWIGFNLMSNGNRLICCCTSRVEGLYTRAQFALALQVVFKCLCVDDANANVNVYVAAYCYYTFAATAAVVCLWFSYWICVMCIISGTNDTHWHRINTYIPASDIMILSMACVCGAFTHNFFFALCHPCELYALKYRLVNACSPELRTSLNWMEPNRTEPMLSNYK